MYSNTLSTFLIWPTLGLIKKNPLRVKNSYFDLFSISSKKFHSLFRQKSLVLYHVKKCLVQQSSLSVSNSLCTHLDCIELHNTATHGTASDMGGKLEADVSSLHEVLMEMDRLVALIG